MMSAVHVQARDVLWGSSDVDAAIADNQQAGQATAQEAVGSGVQAEAKTLHHAHARRYSYFQPFQSGMQQARTLVWMTWAAECSVA